MLKLSNNLFKGSKRRVSTVNHCVQKNGNIVKHPNVFTKCMRKSIASISNAGLKSQTTMKYHQSLKAHQNFDPKQMAKTLLSQSEDDQKIQHHQMFTGSEKPLPTAEVAKTELTKEEQDRAKLDPLTALTKDFELDPSADIQQHLELKELKELLETQKEKGETDGFGYYNNLVKKLELEIELAGFVSAESTFRDALNIAKDKFGPVSPETAHLYNLNAEANFQQGKWQEALTQLDIRIDILKALSSGEGDQTSLVRTIARKADVHHKIGDLDSAIRALERATKYISTADVSVLYFELAYQKAVLILSGNQFRTALNQLYDILNHPALDRVFEENEEGKRVYMYQLYERIAHAYFMDRNVEKSEHFYKQAEGVASSLDEKTHLKHALSVITSITDRLDVSKSYIKEGINMLKPVCDTFDISYLNYGQMIKFERLGQFHATLANLIKNENGPEPSLEQDALLERELMNANYYLSKCPSVGIALANIFDELGLVADRSEKPFQALEYFKKAFIIANKLPNEKYQEGKVLLHMGYHFLKLEDNDEALDHFVSAYDSLKVHVQQRDEVPIELGDALSEMAFLNEKREDFTYAKWCAGEAIQVYNELLSAEDPRFDRLIELRRLMLAKELQSRVQNSDDKIDEEAEERAKKLTEETRHGDYIARGREVSIDTRRKAMDSSYEDHDLRERNRTRQRAKEAMKEKSKDLNDKFSSALKNRRKQYRPKPKKKQ